MRNPAEALRIPPEKRGKKRNKPYLTPQRFELLVALIPDPFRTPERPRQQAEEKQKLIEFSEKKVQTKDEVLAELMAEHIALEKSLGEL